MSTYPVLNDQPIDQWKVTELKNELQKRNLPIKGLKDDLVKRLFEAIQGEIVDGGERTHGGTPLAEELKGGETPGPVDASVYQASVEQNVDEDPSEVTKQGEYPVISVTEASNESLVATTEVSQEAVVGTAEVSQRTLDAVAEVEAPPVDVALAATDENHCETNGVGIESASSGNTIVKEVHPHSEGVVDTIEKTPEDTSKKMDIDDVPSDVTRINIKLGVDVDNKILEQEAVTTPGIITLHADRRDSDVAAAEAEDDTSKKMAIDDVPSDFTSSNVKLAVNVDCKTEHDEVPTQPNAIASHANVVATSESAIPENNFSENTFIYGKDHEDPKHTNGDCKTILCGPNDQVPEVKPDLGSQIKCVSISHDNISNLNADNSDLELESKQEMVKPSSTIPSVGDDLLALDDDKEMHKSGTSLQELGSTTNINLDRKEDSPDGSSPEKLNLDGSSGDESMDEDMMESNHSDSNMKSDDPRGKTKVTSHHVLKELTLLDTVTEGFSAHTEEVVAEEKPPTPTEKRKLEDQEVAASYEQSKRQCQWNADTVNISDQQASTLTGTGTRKEVFRSALKRSFGRSDSTSGDSAKERIVPPPQKPATTSLRIDRFVRPFTLKAVQELLGKTGSVCSFWMDHIKTHCYVTYSSVEEAVATRNAVYNLQWPPNNCSYLVAEFVDSQEVKLKHELPRPSQVPISPVTATAPKTASPFQQSKANQTIPSHAAAASRGLLPTPRLAKPTPTSDPGPARERLPPPPKKPEPALTLDDLFKKTQAYPRIYYTPLSEEEVSVKLAARDKGKRG
ncbi:uncharacterized protein LOC133890840 [Phragmites australis]|uniref:uncharacterized protein LOC133890840 n=1 Tax=Phragmites australis TaxID=29695 RepID=UPI002D78E69D|nr:uncharacterized protein LOC133890840 [Phragmites australis]XP_062187427.1 uncharacterized protein LOC133890840 [Phragmites australis]